MTLRGHERSVRYAKDRSSIQLLAGKGLNKKATMEQTATGVPMICDS